MIVHESGVPLSRFTSLRIGGPAKELYVPETLDDLTEILGSLRDKDPFILGGGTNTLFPDEEFVRPVVSTCRLDRWTIEGSVLRAECGVRLARLMQITLHRGLSGLEGLVGIPGTVGGATAMNAGGGGWNFGDHVEEVGVVPLRGGPVRRLRGNEVAWGYRQANLEGCVVAWAALRLSQDTKQNVLGRVNEYLRRKSRTQPLGAASAGCIFRNPPGQAAARLIDQLGLKGLSRGGAQISERHANFIINAKEARAADVRSLLEYVQSMVAGRFGVRLETEIILA